MKNFRKLSAVALTVAAVAWFGACNGDEDPGLSIDPSVEEIVFEASGMALVGGGTTTFSVSTNQGEWKVESSQTSWLTATPNKTANTFTLTAQPNPSAISSPTAATVTVTAGSATPVTIRVTQLSAAPHLTVLPSARTVAFNADGTVKTGGVVTFNVSTNAGPWTVESDQEWLTYEKTETSFQLVAAAHESQTAPPDAKVTVKAGEAGEVEITVTQDEAEPFLTASPTTPVVLAATGGTQTINVETNYAEWNVTTNPANVAWLTITEQEKSFTLTAGANVFIPAYQAVTVIITAGTAVPVTVQVSQSGNPAGMAAISSKTWTAGNQIWSDYIEYDKFGKVAEGKIDNFKLNYDWTTTPAGTTGAGPYTDEPDYRNNHPEYRTSTAAPWTTAFLDPYPGYMYNWHFVIQHGNELCHSPWRVPSAADAAALDRALGGTGSAQNGLPPAQMQKYTDMGFVSRGRLEAAHWWLLAYANNAGIDAPRLNGIFAFFPIPPQARDLGVSYLLTTTAHATNNLLPVLVELNFTDRNVDLARSPSTSRKGWGFPVRCVRDAE